MKTGLRAMQAGDSIAWAAAYLHEKLEELCCPSCGCELEGHHQSQCDLLPAILDIAIWMESGGDRSASHLDDNDCFRLVEVHTAEEVSQLAALTKSWERG